MILLFLYLSKANIQIFDYFLDQKYQNEYVIKLTTDKTIDPSAIYTEITTTHGQYSKSAPKYAINYTTTAHYEAGRVVSESDPCIFTLEFENAITFSRIFYARRQDTSKGFIRVADLYYAGDSDSDFSFIKTVQYNGDTNKPIVIHLDSTITAKKFRIKFRSVDQDWLSICYLGFGKEDKFIDNVDSIFKDGTWSELKKTKDEINELNNLYKKHVLYGKYDKVFEVANKIIANPNIYLNDIHEILCINAGEERNALRLSYQLSSATSTGMYQLNNQVIDVFCENYGNPGNPQVIFSRLYEDLYVDNYQKVSVQQGWTSITNPRSYGEPTDQTSKFAAVYFSCPISSTKVIKSPRCRVDLSNQTYVVFHKGDNTDEFYDKLVEYNKTVNHDFSSTVEEYLNGAKPSIVEMVGDHSIISTTVKGGFQSISELKNKGKTVQDSIEFYDSINDYYSEYIGLSLSNEYPHHPRNGTYVVKHCNAKTYSGWFAWAFTDIVSFSSQNIFSLGGWGMYHEWGHMTDNSDLAKAEETNNLFSLMMEREYEKDDYTRVEENNEFENLAVTIGYPNDAKKPGTLGQGAGMALYRKIEIAMQVYNNIEHPLAEITKLSRDKWLTSDSIQRYTPYNQPDRWVVATSQVLKKNTAKFFIQCGFNVSKEAISFGNDNKYDEFEEEAIYVTERTLRNKKITPNVIDAKFSFVSSCNTGFSFINFDGNFDDINGFVAKDKSGNIARFTHTNQLKVSNGLDKPVDLSVYPVPLDGTKLRKNPILVNYPGFTDFKEMPVDNITLTLFEGMSSRVAASRPENILNGIVTPDDHSDLSGCFISNNMGAKPAGFTIDFNETVNLGGIYMLTTFDSSFGWTKKFKLEKSLDGIKYETFLANGTIPEYSTRYLPRYIIFGKSVELKYLKFTQISTSNGDNCFHLCDLKFFYPQEKEESSQKLGSGTIAAIVIGVVVVVAALAAGLAFVIIKKKKSKSNNKPDIDL